MTRNTSSLDPELSLQFESLLNFTITAAFDGFYIWACKCDKKIHNVRLYGQF